MWTFAFQNDANPRTDIGVPLDQSASRHHPLNLSSGLEDEVDASRDSETTIDLSSDPEVLDEVQKDPCTKDRSQGWEMRQFLFASKYLRHLGPEEKRTSKPVTREEFSVQLKSGPERHRVDQRNRHSEEKKTSLTRKFEKCGHVADVAESCRKISTPISSMNDRVSVLKHVVQSDSSWGNRDCYVHTASTSGFKGVIQEDGIQDSRSHCSQEFYVDQYVEQYDGDGSHTLQQEEEDKIGSNIDANSRHTTDSQETYLDTLLTEEEHALLKDDITRTFGLDFIRDLEGQQECSASPTKGSGRHSYEAPSLGRQRGDAVPKVSHWPNTHVTSSSTPGYSVSCGNTNTSTSQLNVELPTTSASRGFMHASRHGTTNHVMRKVADGCVDGDNTRITIACSPCRLATGTHACCSSTEKNAFTTGEASHTNATRSAKISETNAAPRWQEGQDFQSHSCYSEFDGGFCDDILLDLSSLEGWQDTIPMVAVDSVSGLHIVIPIELARCNPIPWNLLLGEDKNSSPPEPCGLQSRSISSLPPLRRCSKVSGVKAWF